MSNENYFIIISNYYEYFISFCRICYMELHILYVVESTTISYSKSIFEYS